MIKNESIQEYHSSSALSKTRLWRLKRSPEWFKYCEENKEDENEQHFLFGSAFHKLVLEPDDFSNEFAVQPKFDLRTKDGKESLEQFKNNNVGKQFITESEYDIASAMKESVANNPISRYLTRGDVEKSYYFNDELTGLELKARPDCFKLADWKGLIVDLKSCQSAETETFMRDAIKYGYHVQAALYKMGVESEHHVDCDFLFVAVEKTPPYLVNIIKCDDLFLTYGYDTMRELLGIYEECQRTGKWYGYNGAENIINVMGVPAYVAKQIE